MSISAENTTHESVAASHALPEPTPEEQAQLDQLVERRDSDSKPGRGPVSLQLVFQAVERCELANHRVVRA